jgi:PAS domain S-box-containing protein
MERTMTKRRNSEIFTLADFVKKQKEEEALDKIHEAVFLIDGHARFVYVNDEACRNLGYSRRELLKMHIEELDPSCPIEKWTREWCGTIEDDGSAALDVRLKRKDGSFFFTEVVTSVFESNGMGYNLAICRDAARQKELRDHQSTNHANYHGLLTNSESQ